MIDLKMIGLEYRPTYRLIIHMSSVQFTDQILQNYYYLNIYIWILIKNGRVHGKFYKILPTNSLNIQQ